MNSKPSKSARKREYLALQVLGERLIGLTAEQLQGIGLEESLLEAVRAAKSMRTHGALRRQKQLIGKIMRTVDPCPIAAAIRALGKTDRIEKEIFRRAEVWRDRLASDDTDALAEFSTLIGNRNDALADAVNSWVSAPDDDSRRMARRRIFREIHKELTAKMQKQTISI
jgi:ribosome-associated protein